MNLVVVRIDNSHGRPHIDRLYRRDVGKKPDFDGGLWDAFAQLKANWKEYAQRFEEVHGWPDNQP